MSELTLFDALPLDVPESGSAATVYGHGVNIEHGHLLIASEFGDWMFVWTGGGFLRAYFPGWTTGIDMTADQLQILGDYCQQMTERCKQWVNASCSTRPC